MSKSATERRVSSKKSRVTRGTLTLVLGTFILAALTLYLVGVAEAGFPRPHGTIIIAILMTGIVAVSYGGRHSGIHD